jgi:hypothetical protein
MQLLLPMAVDTALALACQSHSLAAPICWRPTMRVSPVQYQKTFQTVPKGLLPHEDCRIR